MLESITDVLLPLLTIGNTIQIATRVFERNAYSAGGLEGAVKSCIAVSRLSLG